MQKYLFILSGLPFVGKTTLANAICKRFNLPHIDLDIINRKRGIGVKEKDVTSMEWGKTYKQSYKLTVDFLRNGKSVVYDSTNFIRKQRKKLIEIATVYKAKPIIIYLDVSRRDARKRLIENRRSNNRYDVKDNDFNHVADNFEIPTSEEGVIFVYSSTDNAESWIKENLVGLLEVK